MIQMLGDSSLKVQRSALDVLAERDSAAIPALERALLNVDLRIRVGAATALLRIHDDPELPYRIIRFPDFAPHRKAVALEALEKAHHPLPALAALCRELAADPDSAVCQAAKEVLRIVEPSAAQLEPSSSRPLFGWKRMRRPCECDIPA